MASARTCRGKSVHLIGKKRPCIVIQDLELTPFRHRVRSSGYIINLLALFSSENQSIRKRNFKGKLTVKYLRSANLFVMM